MIRYLLFSLTACLSISAAAQDAFHNGDNQETMKARCSEAMCYSRLQVFAAGADSNAVEFAYDYLDRLTLAHYSINDSNEAFTIDDLGNRDSVKPIMAKAIALTTSQRVENGTIETWVSKCEKKSTWGCPQFHKVVK